MTTMNVIRKVSQSIRRNSGATLGGGGGPFTGSAGSAGSGFAGAGPVGLPAGFFALSLVIHRKPSMPPSRTRKRADTRRGTSHVCPFECVGRNLVFGQF